MNATEQPIKTWSNLLGYWFACPITGAACGPFKDRAARDEAIEKRTGLVSMKHARGGDR